MSANSLASTKLAPYSDVPGQSLVRSATAVTLFSLVALMLGVGLLLAARRLAGAITFALPWDATVIIALAALLLVTAIRTTWRRAFPLADHDERGLTAGDLCVGWGSSAALLLTAVGCSFPGTRVGDWLVWLAVVGVDQFLRHSFLKGKLSALNLLEPREAPRVEERGQVVQQLFRVRDAQGHELIHGTLRADFQAGQRNAVLHVGFCPPLEYLPRIEAAPQSGEAATIKVVQALAHGARLDVRLPETPAESRQLLVDFTAAPRLAL